MGMELDTTGKQQVNVHYVNTPVPCVVQENFGGYDSDQDIGPLAEVLQHQETVHQSLRRNGRSEITRPSPTSDSRHNEFELQLARDEALARELQELEFNKEIDIPVAETSETDSTSTESSAGNGEGSSANTQIVREDSVDPDNMSYEELRTVTEAVGSESRGLSDELIAYLPSSTYKIGLFSKREKHEECAICCEAYKNRDKLLRLFCQHEYHKACITKWLKMEKTCPICKEEVFG